MRCCEDCAKLFGSSCFWAANVAGSLDLVIDSQAFFTRRARNGLFFNWGCKGFFCFFLKIKSKRGSCMHADRPSGVSESCGLCKKFMGLRFEGIEGGLSNLYHRDLGLPRGFDGDRRPRCLSRTLLRGRIFQWLSDDTLIELTARRRGHGHLRACYRFGPGQGA